MTDKMNSLKWMGHSEVILDMQRNVYEDAASCDVSISCGGRKLRAHKFILSSCSDYFRYMLSDIGSDQEPTIIIPGMKEYIMESVLIFIYFGEVSVKSSNLSEFLETMNLLGIKSAISFDCHLNKGKATAILPTVEDPADDDDKETEEEDSNTAEACRTKDFEYLEVYNEEAKIGQYTIEHIEQDSNGDYILADNSDNSFELAEEDTGDDDKQNDTLEFTEENVTDDIIMKDDDDDKSTDDDKLKLDSSVFNSMMASRQEAFDGAVRAVIDCGMSLQKAATKYNISKTVLWRRVKKHPQYRIYRENPLIESAIEKLQNGESLKSISLALEIPMSTLHRHKMRLLQEGRLPDHVQVKKRDSKETLKIRLSKAVEACKDGMSQNHAANVFGVPKSTLWRHLQKQKLKSTEIIEDITLAISFSKGIKEEEEEEGKNDIIQEVSLSS